MSEFIFFAGLIVAAPVTVVLTMASWYLTKRVLSLVGRLLLFVTGL